MAVNFNEVAANFELTPEEALNYFIEKGLTLSISWDDLLAEEHDLAFTIAKMMDYDLLRTVFNAVGDAIADGKTLADFKSELIPVLQKAGWVPEQGTLASRLETIFRTNIQSAYSAGHWQSIEKNKASMPYLMYDAVDDDRTRISHEKHDGVLLKVGHAFWNVFYPPNGYNCRCSVIQLDKEDMADLGLAELLPPKISYKQWINPRTGKMESVPSSGVDPGFHHNPGKHRKKVLDDLAEEKRRRAEDAA